MTILALIVRLIYLAEMGSGPFAGVLYLDALRYDGWARVIAFGENIAIEPYFRAPLYPLVLAFLYKVFGHDLLVVRFFQMLISSVSTILIYLIAEKVFDRRIALTSGVMWAFYGPALYWGGEVLIVTLIVFLDLFALYVLLSDGDRTPWWKLFSAGGILGLSAIARPTILIFAPIAVLWAMYGTADRAFHRIRTSLFRALLVAFGLFLPVVAVTVHNYVNSGDFIFISSQGGINFFMGNNPQADGKTAATPERGGIYGEYLDNAWVSSVRIAEKVSDRSLRPSEVSGFWYREGLRFISGHPVQWAKLMLEKIGYFWSGTEVTNNEDTYFFRRYSTILSIFMWRKFISFPFGIVSPLAILGMVAALKRGRNVSLLSAFVLLYMLGVVLFFVCGRYRMPVIPVLIIFASFSLFWLVEKVRERKWKIAVPAVTALILLGAAANSDYGGVNDRNRAQARYFAGWAFHQNGDFDRALALYDEARGYFPRHLQVQNNRGLIYAERGEFEKAIEAFRAAVDINPVDPMPRFYLATAYLSAGMLREAAEEYEEVLSLNPDNALAAYRAGVAYSEIGERVKAVELLTHCLRVDPGNSKARAMLESLENLPQDG